MGLREVVLERVVSWELDVKGVLAKVQLGVADAGIVYASDVTGVRPGDLVSFEFPPAARVRARYLVAATSARSGGAGIRWRWSTAGRSVGWSATRRCT